MIDLFMYWEGPMLSHIDVCIKSVQKSLSASVKFNLVTPENLHCYVPSWMLHSHIERLSHAAHRADCIRAVLMSLYGGFYFDADTIGLRCPSEIISEDDLIYCVWDRQPERVINAYVYCQPGSKLAREWLRLVNYKLESLNEAGDIGWTGLGEKLLTTLVNCEVFKTRKVSRSTFLPIDVDHDPRRLFEDAQPFDFIQPETVCFGLNNSWMMVNRPCEMNVINSHSPELQVSPLLVHRLFNETIERIKS